MFSTILFLVGILTLSSPAYGWGELGHHVIGRTAAKQITSHPRIVDERQRLEALGPDGTTALTNLKLFLETFERRSIQQGHLANIPDIYWKSYDIPLEEDAYLLGGPTHWFDVDRLVAPGPEGFPLSQIPLNYQQAKLLFESQSPDLNVFKNGNLVWRTQQLASLYKWTLQNYPKKSADELKAVYPHPTMVALTYAGIMTHKTGDVTMPYHNTKDYDGVYTGQKGIHAYFETTLVNGLYSSLDTLVSKKTKLLFTEALPNAEPITNLTDVATGSFPSARPEQKVTALMIAASAESFSRLDIVRKYDLTYAIATLKEALTMDSCKDLPQVKQLKSKYEKTQDPTIKEQIGKTKILSTRVVSVVSNEEAERLSPPCRRSTDTLVDVDGFLSTSQNAKTVANWHEEIISDRLALGAALTADIWVNLWFEAGSPPLYWTWRYALKPSFVSPTDATCFGYALEEDPQHFLKKDKTSALPWKEPASSIENCVTF